MRLVMCFALLALAGCTGEMTAVVRSADGKPQGPVDLSFKTGGFGGRRMMARLPDGETFTGKFVEIASEASTSSFGTGSGSGDPAEDNAFGRKYSHSTVTIYSGDVEATLIGSRGHVMTCHLRAANPGSGLSSGGIGVCEISDGRVINTHWDGL